MSQLGDDYADIVVRPMPIPTPDRFGSWWRRRWHFDVARGGRNFRIPPPIGDAAELQAVVSSWWDSDSRLVLELHTRKEVLDGDELTYISIVAAWLRVCFPGEDIMVNGIRDHAILKMSRLSPDVIQDLRERNYG